MTIAKQIEQVSTGANKRFSKTFIASLLKYTRKTLYIKIRDNAFTAIEIKILKDNGVIN